MSHQVQCVNENFRAIDVFAFLRERQVSFAPVVDMKNKLISVVSLRDLRILVDQKDFSILDLPIIDFIGVVRQNDIPETKVIFMNYN